MINIKIRLVPPSVNVDWLMSTVLKEIRQYNLLSVKVTDPVFCWGYDIKAKIQIGKENMEKAPYSIEIEGGRESSVIMRRRQPQYYWCHCRGHFKRERGGERKN